MVSSQIDASHLDVLHLETTFYYVSIYTYIAVVLITKHEIIVNMNYLE